MLEVSATELADSPIQEKHEPRLTATQWAALIVTLCVGVAVRLRIYLTDRSLWLDEASSALHMLRRGYFDVIRVMQFGEAPVQSGPVGYWWTGKLMAQLLGPTEDALRLVPLLAGCAALVLIAWLAKKVIGPRGMLLAVAFMALAPSLVYYSDTCKAYTLDVCSTLLVLLAGLSVVRENGSRGSLWRFGIIGSFCLLMSQPAPAVLMSIAGCLVMHQISQKRVRQVGIVSGIAIVWLAAFAGLYRYQVGQAGATLARMFEVDFSRGFINFPPRSFGDLQSYPRVLMELLTGIFDAPISSNNFVVRSSTLALMAVCIGGYTLFKRDRWALLLICAPLLAALVLSAAHKHPILGRVALYLSPCIALLIAAGLSALYDIRGGYRFVGPLATVCFLFLPVLFAVNVLQRSYAFNETQSVMQQMLPHVRDGDTLVVHWASSTPFYYYRDQLQPERWKGTKLALKPEDQDWKLFLESLAGTSRVWILYADIEHKDPAEIETILSFLGRRQQQYEAPGAFAWLYDLTPAKPTTQP